MNCTVCGRKISWIRRLVTWKHDRNPSNLIPLSQFCNNLCAADGLIELSRKIENGELIRKNG
jgi:hypothetical protein